MNRASSGDARPSLSQRRQLVRVYAVAIASIGAAAVGNVLCYKIVAVVGTPEVFSDYSTARRYLTFALPIVLMGAGVALPLRTSINPDPSEARRILYIQLILAAGVVTIGMIFLTTAPSASVNRIPGLTSAELAPLLVMIFAFNCTSMLYAYHRGFLDFGSGAYIVVLANGIFPTIGALFASRGAATAIWIWAVLCLGLAARGLWQLGWPGRGRISNLGSLLRSSIGRMPGDVAYAALYLVPVAQMQGIGDPLRQSVFNYFFVLLGVVTAAAAPISSVLLPVVGARVAREGTFGARRILVVSICMATSIGLALWGVMTFASGTLVRLLLDETYLPQAHVLSSLGPAALGLALFVFLKSVLDGSGEKPISAVISVLSLFIYLVARLLDQGDIQQSIIFATDSALLFLGAATTVTSLWIFMTGKRAWLTSAGDSDIDPQGTV